MTGGPIIVEYIRYSIPAQAGDAFEAAYQRAGTVLDADAHCLAWEVARCVEHPDRYVVRIEWDSVEGHLQGFRASAGFRTFSEAVAPFVDDIVEMTHHRRLDPGAAPKAPTVYGHAGGADAFGRLTHLFYAKVVRDPLLEPLFRGMAADHPERVALWLGEVFGGPPAYTRTRGGYPTMVLAHINRDISEEQRRRWVELLLGTLDEAGLPRDARFRRTFREYIEWGTGLAVRNSKPGFTPPREAHVPRWPWSTTPD